jgi:hypothetical protein
METTLTTDEVVRQRDRFLRSILGPREALRLIQRMQTFRESAAALQPSLMRSTTAEDQIP